jgi:uncharacterized SAM-dependent methyltransferase
MREGVWLSPKISNSDQKKDLTPVAQNLTAEFNFNVLRRINRELGAYVDIDAFSHRADLQ